MREFRAKPVVEALTQEYKKQADELKSRGVVPALAIVRVGKREDDLAYERGIIKRFESAVCEAKVHELPEDVTFETVRDLLIQPCCRLTIHCMIRTNVIQSTGLNGIISCLMGLEIILTSEPSMI